MNLVTLGDFLKLLSCLLPLIKELPWEPESSNLKGTCQACCASTPTFSKDFLVYISLEVEEDECHFHAFVDLFFFFFENSPFTHAPVLNGTLVSLNNVFGDLHIVKRVTPVRQLLANTLPM